MIMLPRRAEFITWSWGAPAVLCVWLFGNPCPPGSRQQLKEQARQPALGCPLCCLFPQASWGGGLLPSLWLEQKQAVSTFFGITELDVPRISARIHFWEYGWEEAQDRSVSCPFCLPKPTGRNRVAGKNKVKSLWEDMAPYLWVRCLNIAH